LCMGPELARCVHTIRQHRRLPSFE
jgi:hypothetical protein